MIAAAISTLTNNAEIPSQWADVMLVDCHTSIPTERRAFVGWYLSAPRIFVTGEQRDRVASAILRQTFTYNPERTYLKRAHYGTAFEEILRARDDINALTLLGEYRSLVLADVDALTTEFQLTILIDILRNRRNRGRMTILTAPLSVNLTANLPRDLHGVLIET